MSRQVVTAALIVGALALASPATAQRQRNPGGGGGGQERGGQGSGRAAAPAPDRDGRGGRPEANRGEQPRPHAAPPPSGIRQSTPRIVDRGRYGVPRGQADVNRGDDSRRNDSPAVAGRAPVAPRHPSPGYADRAYTNRGYAGRYVDPGSRVRPGYAVPRAYAVPRGYVGPRGYGGYDGARGYDGRGYYGRPRYIAPGWRGSWGGYAVATPRFISPYVLGYGAWQPYYYRPSIGLGLYYGADGLYPFGSIPQTYYDPSPGVAYGGLRITDAPRDAQVFADGYYAGIVDDFDGVFQHLNLEPGEHRVEIHAPGLTPIAFDVMVQPGRTITLRADIY